MIGTAEGRAPAGYGWARTACALQTSSVETSAPSRVCILHLEVRTRRGALPPLFRRAAASFYEAFEAASLALVPFRVVSEIII